MNYCKVLNNGDTYRNIRANINENFETLENKIKEKSQTAAYDDTEVKESIRYLKNNDEDFFIFLKKLKFGEFAGGYNLVYKTIKYATIEDGTILETGEKTNVYVAKVESDKTYTIQSDRTAYAFYSDEPDFGSVSYDVSVTTSGSMTITIPSGVSYIAFIAQNTYTTPMVYEGSFHLEYEPYIESLKMLTEEVKKLNDSLGDYNYATMNPTIDAEGVFSDGELQVDTLRYEYGYGRYALFGKGNSGYCSGTIDIWSSLGINVFVCNVIYSNKTSSMFAGKIEDYVNIRFDADYFSHCDHIVKLCTLLYN